MIRVVPTGDLGLDVLLGGGWRLVKRFRDQESATVVVRGGSGSGKTLVGIQVALELARALGGDVAVACVEILPTEYAAQLQSARPSLDAGRVIQLPAEASSGESPRVFVALLTRLDPEAPDLVTNLDALGKEIERIGGKPVVYVIDSLIEGYGIGSSVDRIDADEMMKFAASGGYGLVLCEETATDAPSPWVFAADTVLQLGVESRERGRWIEVHKHRFGPSATGRHELDLVGRVHPEVFPAPHAWRAGWVRDVLETIHWRFSTALSATPLLKWEWIGVAGGDANLQGAFSVVTCTDAHLARVLAMALVPLHRPSPRDLIIEIDPLALRGGDADASSAPAFYLTSSDGPARALRALFERFADTFDSKGVPQIGRVLIGDVGSITGGSEASTWTDAIRVFASWLVASTWGVPVIVYARDEGDGPGDLGATADAWIRVVTDREHLVAEATTRWPSKKSTTEWAWPAVRQWQAGDVHAHMARPQRPASD